MECRVSPNSSSVAPGGLVEHRPLRSTHLSFRVARSKVGPNMSPRELASAVAGATRGGPLPSSPFRLRVHGHPV